MFRPHHHDQASYDQVVACYTDQSFVHDPESDPNDAAIRCLASSVPFLL